MHVTSCWAKLKKDLRIMLEIQTILQKNLQTADVMSDYW